MGLDHLELGCTDCSDQTDQLMSVRPRAQSHPSAIWLCPFQVSSCKQLSNGEPRLQDVCLIHVASIVPSKGLDIKLDFANENHPIDTWPQHSAWA